jgi:hypothetical protein
MRSFLIPRDWAVDAGPMAPTRRDDCRVMEKSAVAVDFDQTISA